MTGYNGGTGWVSVPMCRLLETWMVRSHGTCPTSVKSEEGRHPSCRVEREQMVMTRKKRQGRS
jgi:hypothetical protein